MTQAETVPLTKPFELTDEQQKNATRICDQMVVNVQRSTEDKVKQACEDMDRVGIPKQTICYLVCQRAGEMGYSEGHLRRLVPTEYKDQAQREVRLIHEGEHDVHQHETKTLQVNNEDDIKLEVNDSKDIMKKGRLTANEQIKMYQEEARLAKKKLAEYRVDNDYTPIFKCIREQRSDAELAEKVRNFMKENKTYKEWLKQEDAFEASLTVEGKTKEQAYLDNNINNEITVPVKSKSKKSKKIK
jgi:hypothetical protein